MRKSARPAPTLLQNAQVGGERLSALLKAGQRARGQAPRAPKAPLKLKSLCNSSSVPAAAAEAYRPPPLRHRSGRRGTPRGRHSWGICAAAGGRRMPPGTALRSACAVLSPQMHRPICHLGRNAACGKREVGEQLSIHTWIHLGIRYPKAQHINCPSCKRAKRKTERRGRQLQPLQWQNMASWRGLT